METVLYTVRQGDTLYAIAKRFCTTVNMIARYNGIADPDHIEAGQLLRIPVSEIPAMQKEKAVPYREYIVKKGDTLSAIAEKNGVGFRRVAAFNGLADADRIQEGQVLKIPFPLREDGTQESFIGEGDALTALTGYDGTTPEPFAERRQPAEVNVVMAVQSLLPQQEDDPEALEYIVQEGDTLWQIARQYGVSTAYLVNKNRLCQPDKLRVGQVIVIRSPAVS